MTSISILGPPPFHACLNLFIVLIILANFGLLKPGTAMIPVLPDKAASNASAIPRSEFVIKLASVIPLSLSLVERPGALMLKTELPIFFLLRNSRPNTVPVLPLVLANGLPTTVDIADCMVVSPFLTTSTGFLPSLNARAIW